ncbi:MAG TPA: hypothetical protein P5110_01165 [Candidatus Omnitrophota bacterium]|nr:hypothetical protein [Candidatus Omnitrophota bacterium]HRZ14095.1 hypothetical protein [Candidatus Omnitrophota bacterium]
MGRFSRVLAVVSVSCIFLAGCTTLTGYHKKVTVEKDQDGKIVKTIIEEEIHQPNLQAKVSQFKYLDQ